MEKALVVIAITIPSIVCLFLTWYFWFKAKHQERLLLIEKGIERQPQSIESKSRSPLLKIGIVIIGLSAGLLIINMLHSVVGLQMSDAAAMSIMGLCGGMSLVAANFASNVNGK
jgi:hypothetical protein